MKFNSISTLVIIILSCHVLHSQTSADSLTMRLEQLHKQSTFTGVAVSIFNAEGVLYKNAFGYADIDNKIRYSTQNIQNIGSVSKTYIAAALMKAVESRKVSLDDPINKHLSFKVINPKYPNNPIKVRHLATHTSGIKDWKFYRKAYVVSEDISSWTKESINIKKVPIRRMVSNTEMSLENYLKAYLIKGEKYYSKSNYTKRKPGEKYQYSNIAAALLAQVIEGATGEDFNAYSSRVVLEELGLYDSGWRHQDVDMSKHAILYGPEDKEIPLYKLNTYPDGGLISNVDDLTTYMITMFQGYNGSEDYLSNASFKEMLSSQWSRPEFATTKNTNENIGIIWDLGEKNEYVGHNGSDPGTFSFVRFFPEKNIGFIVLSNCGIDEEKSRMKSLTEMLRSMSNFGKRMNQ